MPAERSKAEDGDEVAPSGADPAKTPDREREEADREQPDRDPDEDRGRGQERVEPAARSVGGLAGQSALAQEPGGGQGDDDRDRFEHEPARADPEDRRIVALEIAARSPGHRHRRGEQEGGRTERHQDRADRRHGARACGHDEPGEGQADQGRGDGDEEALPQLRRKQLPARRPAATREGERRAPATDDQDADEPDRTGRHGQRSERGDRQGRLGRRPLPEIALHEAEEARANEDPSGSGRSRRDERGVQPAQVRHEDIQHAGVEPVDIDEHVPAIAVRQVEPDQVLVGRGREDGRRRRRSGRRPCRRCRPRRGSGRRTSSGAPGSLPRRCRRPRKRPLSPVVGTCCAGAGRRGRRPPAAGHRPPRRSCRRPPRTGRSRRPAVRRVRPGRVARSHPGPVSRAQASVHRSG